MSKVFQGVFGNVLKRPFVGRSIQPNEIPFLLAHHDSSDSSTITEVANAVSNVADKTGNGNALVQSTGALQPSTNSTTIGGLNAINSDGTEYFEIPSLPDTDNMTFISVFRVTGTNSALDAIYSMDGTNSFEIDALVSGQFHAEMDSTGLGAGALGAPSDIFQLDVCLAVRFSVSFSTVSLRLFGIEFDSTTYTGGLSNSGFFRYFANRGAGQIIAASMGENLIYSDAVSDANLIGLENYLGNKWSV